MKLINCLGQQRLCNACLLYTSWMSPAPLLPQAVEACKNHYDSQALQAAYSPLKPSTHLTVASHIEGTRANPVSYTHLDMYKRQV